MRGGGITEWFRASGIAASVLIVLIGGMLRAQEPPGPSQKRVEVDKTHQLLRAYEGDRLILESRVSTGKGNSTPNGSYQVQGKQRMHYSRRYDNAPMPYSVQVSGHYFIHGFTYVPDRPASHGCVRLPLSNGNPARAFYDWVEVDTPVEIIGRWP
jgi:lipoprotein-anchoring transpeptidase ErfK/SrfK